MKAGESFQLNAAWWKKGKPVNLKTTGLGAALTTYGTAKTAFTAQKRNNQKFEAALAALEAVNAARLKAIALCGNDHTDTKAALQRANAISVEMGTLKAAKKQTFVASLRQLKTRVDDLKNHSKRIFERQRTAIESASSAAERAFSAPKKKTKKTAKV